MLYGDPFIEQHIAASTVRLQQQMALLRQQIPKEYATNLAALSRAYPTLHRDILTAAAYAGEQPGTPVMQDIAIRSAIAQAEDEEHGGGLFGLFDTIWDETLGIFKGTLRTGFTVFDMLWEEGLARPFKTAVATLGLSDQDFFADPIGAWQEAGTSYGVRAIGKILSGGWDEINLGSGFLPRSNLAQDDPEYKNLVAAGMDPRIAEQKVQARLGDPITYEARQSQEQLTMHGLPISPGRFATIAAHELTGGVLLEPGSTAFNIMSGALDAAAQIGTMRAGRIPNVLPARIMTRAPYVGVPLFGKGGRGGISLGELAGARVPGVGGWSYPVLGDPAGTALKHIGLMRQASRTFSDIPTEAWLDILKGEGYGPVYRGLARIGRRMIHSPGADEWIASPTGQALVDLVDNHIDENNVGVLIDWMTRGNPHLPKEFFLRAAGTGIGGSGESFSKVLRDYINARNIVHVPGGVAGTRPFRGSLGRAITGQGPEVGRLPTETGLAQLQPLGGALGRGRIARWGADDTTRHAVGPGGVASETEADLIERFAELGTRRAAARTALNHYGWGRLFNEMPGRVVDVEDTNQGFYDLNDWMNAAGFSTARKSHYLNRWAREVTPETGHGAAYDVATSMFDEWAEMLVATGAPTVILKKLKQVFRDEDTLRKFFVDNTGTGAWHPASRWQLLRLDDDVAGGLAVPSPQAMSEFLDRAIPLPDAREMRKAMSPSRRWLLEGMDPKSRLKKFWLKSYRKGSQVPIELNENVVQRVLDVYMQKAWKPMTLLRVAWPVRVIMEEQVRVGAAGFDSLINNPIRAISWMISDPKAGWFSKVMNNLGMRPRGVNLTSIDFGDLDTRMIEDFVAAARKGRKVDDAAQAMKQAGFDIDPNNAQDIAMITRIREEGLSGEDVLLRVAQEYRDALSTRGSFLWGAYLNPVTHDAWVDIRNTPQHRKTFTPAWARELVQLRGDDLAKVVAADGMEAAAQWLTTAKGRAYLQRFVKRAAKDDQTSRSIYQLALDPQNGEQARRGIAGSMAARIELKTGGQARLGRKTGEFDEAGNEIIDWIAWTGQKQYTAEVTELLQDASRWDELVYDFTGPRASSDKLREMIASGRLDDLVVDDMGTVRTQRLVDALDDEELFSFAPDVVKGAADSEMARVFGNSYDRVINTLFDMLMTRPTNYLSRSPAFRQSLWRFIDENLEAASPAVMARVMTAAKNANLPADMMTQLHRRMGAAQAAAARGAAYGRLHPDDARRGGRIVAMSQHTDDELVGMMMTKPRGAAGSWMDDLHDADDVEKYLTERFRNIDDDTISDADLAFGILVGRIRNADGTVNVSTFEAVRDAVAHHLGVDLSPAGAQGRNIIKARAEGQTWAQIAEQEGIAASTARRRYDKAIQDLAPPQAAYLLRETDEVAGKTVVTNTQQLADQFGVSQRTIRRWIQQQGHAEDILDTDLDKIWQAFESEGTPFRLLEGHFDRYTDTVGGGRQLMSPHAFDDLKDGDTLLTDGFEEFMELAKAHALEDVKDLLYDVSRRHQIMDMLRNVFPFGEAWIEIITAWSRLIAENPQIVRRGQQIIEGGRESGGLDEQGNPNRGFFFTDPQTGEEVFNYPGAGLLFNAATRDVPLNTMGTAGIGAAGGMTAGATIAGGALGAALGGGLGAAGAAVGSWAGLPGLMTGGLGVNILGDQPLEPGFRFQAGLSSLNLMAGSYIPGFGPVVQWAASSILGDNPTFDGIKKIIAPFGDQRIRTWQDMIDMTLPRWMQRFVSALGIQDPDQERLFGNTVADVYKTLLLSQGQVVGGVLQVPALDPDEQRKLMDQAKGIASKLAMYRSFAYMFAPAAPTMRFEVKDRNGELWLFQTLGTEYRRLLYEKHNGDDAGAFDEFTRLYGLDPTLFATPMSVSIETRSVTAEGSKWERRNEDLFDKAPATAYFAHPDEPGQPFDYAAYTRQLESDARVGLTPEQWAARRNDTLGRILFEKARREVETSGLTGRKQTVVLRMMRTWLTQEYPGYKVPSPGAPQTYSTDQKLDEFRREWFGLKPTGLYADGTVRWEGDYTGGDERLRDSDAGKALALWFQAVDRATQKATADGYSASGLWTADATWAYREALRMLAGDLMRSHNDFMYIYRLILEKQFPDDEFTTTNLRARSTA